MRMIMSLGLALLSLTSCGAVHDAIDCHKICDRYKSCFDSSYDESGCEDRCRDNANKNADYEKNVNDCEDCIDDKSCTSATFTCGASCSNVVP